MQEVWKDVKGYEGFYRVSNLGRAKSLDRFVGVERGNSVFNRKIKGTILKPNKNYKGYLKVQLCKDGEKKHVSIHRLVAVGFIEQTEDRKCVNHLDLDKTNNCVSNLEWCSSKENSQHFFSNNGAVIRDLKGAKNGRAKLNGNQISVIRKLKGEISMSKLAKMFSVSLSQINRIVYNKQWVEVK